MTIKYWVIATNGIGFWPDGRSFLEAWRYERLEYARNVLQNAALTEWGRGESGVIEVVAELTPVETETRDAIESRILSGNDLGQHRRDG